MSRKFGDIINNLEKQMENYIQQRADINSFGKVIAIGDGAARVFGLIIFCFLEQLHFFRKAAPVLSKLFTKSHDYLV